MTGPLRIAFQGELGAFSDEAIQQLWGSDVERVPRREFQQVVDALVSGAADRAVLPLENTIVGSVPGTHDVIDATPGIAAIAETVVAVHHCLLGAPGARLADVHNVFSHPVALAQCGNYFRANPQLAVHAVYDTAGAAKDVANLADVKFAALCSRQCAALYGLELLAAGVEDRPDNQTRFLVFANQPLPLPADTPARTMLLLTTDDVPGALLAALAPLSRRGMNLRRLESRPTGEPWSYRFFLEFDHQAGDRVTEELLQDVTANAAKVRIVGTYPRWAAGRRGSIGWRMELPKPD